MDTMLIVNNIVALKLTSSSSVFKQVFQLNRVSKQIRL